MLIVEDGGYLVRRLHRGGSPLLAMVLGAVEQTTKGLWPTENWGREIAGDKAVKRDLEGVMYFPLISVPDSRIKQEVEPPIIGNLVVQCIQALTSNLSLPGAPVALLGLGTIGMKVDDFLKSLGARVVGYDPSDERVTRFITKGGYKAATAVEAVRGSRLVIGCSGKKSITSDVLANVDHGACVVSASSDLEEIDRDYLENAKIRSQRLAIKDQQWKEGNLWAGTRYILPGPAPREINLLADGYPVTFWGFPGMPHEGGDLIMTVILVAAAELAARNRPDRDKNAEPYPNQICRQAVDELGKEYQMHAQYLRSYHPDAL